MTQINQGTNSAWSAWDLRNFCVIVITLSSLSAIMPICMCTACKLETMGQGWMMSKWRHMNHMRWNLVFHRPPIDWVWSRRDEKASSKGDMAHTASHSGSKKTVLKKTDKNVLKTIVLTTGEALVLGSINDTPMILYSTLLWQKLFSFKILLFVMLMTMLLLLVAW